MANLPGKLINLSNVIIKYATPRFKTFLYYAKVELVPPKPKDIPEIKNNIVRLVNAYRRGAWKELTVKEAFLNTLITTEVVCWFFIGECLGKRHFVGYDLGGH